MVSPTRLMRALPLMAAGAFAPTLAHAHAIVGARFFPATIATDDPGVADELTLPQISIARTPDQPPNTETDISAEWDKRLTADFGVGFNGDWTDIRMPGGTISGFQNFGTTFKYHLLSNEPHELMISVGVVAEWGGTGSVGAGGATVLTPNLYFGKGFGDLPPSMSWARPLAITGVIGYQTPLKGGLTRSLETGFAVEYSLRYLASQVRDLGLPRFVNQMTPLVEVQLSTPLTDVQGAPPTGTINPGVIWSGKDIQIGAEAMVPINAASGHGVGAVLQVHWFIDDLFPHSLGKPIW